MGRLINADALRQDMYHEAFETDSEMQKWDSGCWIRYKMFEQQIDKQPTVDAVSVVHGHWISSGYACGETDWECSVCHCHEWRTGKTEYCMRCGAKMDEPTQSNDSNVLNALGEKVTE